MKDLQFAHVSRHRQPPLVVIVQPRVSNPRSASAVRRALMFALGQGRAVLWVARSP